MWRYQTANTSFVCSVLLANIVAELWLALTDLWEFNSFSKLALDVLKLPYQNWPWSSVASSPPAHQALGLIQANANLLHRCHSDGSMNTKSVNWWFFLFVCFNLLVTLCSGPTVPFELLTTWVFGCVNLSLPLTSLWQPIRDNAPGHIIHTCLTITPFLCQIMKQYFSLVGQHWP